MFYEQGISIQAAGREKIEVLPLPQQLKDEVPAVGDFVQNRWCALARDLVADIQGKAHRNYLTFRDGLAISSGNRSGQRGPRLDGVAALNTVYP